MKLIIAVFSVGLLTVAIASPAGVYVGPNGEVGASWGGYSASAGLGGLVSGGKVGTRGGLHAEAGTPDGHFAAAGLGGSVSEGGQEGGLYSVAGHAGGKPVVKPVVVSGGSSSNSQASASATASATATASGGSNAGSSAGSGTNVNHVHYVVHNKRPSGTFFDDIFNIPISVLGAVNKFLNNKNGAQIHGTTVVSSVSTSNNHVQQKPVKPVVVASQSQASSSATATASATASSSANAGSSSNAGSGTVAAGGIDNNIYHGTVYHKHHHHGGNFDDIFNIPISVLGAVNRLLNNGKK